MGGCNVTFAGTTHIMKKFGGGVLWVSEAGSVMGRNSDRVPAVGNPQVYATVFTKHSLGKVFSSFG